MWNDKNQLPIITQTSSQCAFECVFFRSGVMRLLFTPFELLAVIIHKYGPEKKEEKSTALNQARRDPGAHWTAPEQRPKKRTSGDPEGDMRVTSALWGRNWASNASLTAHITGRSQLFSPLLDRWIREEKNTQRGESAPDATAVFPNGAQRSELH